MSSDKTLTDGDQNSFIELTKLIPKANNNGPGTTTSSKITLRDELVAKALMDEEIVAAEMELAQTVKDDDEFVEIKSETDEFLTTGSEIDDDGSSDDEDGEDEVEKEKCGKNKKSSKNLTLKDISCPECGEILKTKSGLTRHVTTKHNKKPTTIVVSRRSTTKNANSNVQKSRFSFTCPLCNVKFATRTDLKKHLENLHEGAAVLKCDVCERYKSKIWQKFELKANSRFKSYNSLVGGMRNSYRNHVKYSPAG